MLYNEESESNLSAELQQNAVDVLGLSVKGASGVTVVAGGATWYSPSTIGLVIAIGSFLVTMLLAWKKNKIYNLQLEELERHRKNA